MMKQKVRSGGMFRWKKVLVMGLGLHGGGAATVRWLLLHGAKVTTTDLRTPKVLAPSLRALRGLPIRFVLGKHRMADFRSHDLIVVGPGVLRESPYLEVAKKAGKTIENDASLFFRYLTNPVIAVTGTRGKTTTTLWVAELLKKKYPAVRQSGTPDNAELREFERINKKNIPAVVELSSWQLEYLPQSGKAPHVAAITNIYPEHLNRYRNIKHYASAKANIFLHQHKEDMLVLNYDDPWHKYFLNKKPKSAVYFISTKVLPKKLKGAYVKNGELVLRIPKNKQGRTLLKETTILPVERFVRERGKHNMENLLQAVLIAKLFDPKLKVTERDALLLPIPHMRQETIYRKGRLMIINDSAATSPDGTIAAIKRFATPLQGRTKIQGLGKIQGLALGATSSRPDLVFSPDLGFSQTLKHRKPKVILIAGGTDKKLEFDGLAKEIKKYIPKKQLVLLEGSATTKLIASLRKQKYFSQYEPLEYLDLASCIKEAFRVARQIQGAADSTRSEKDTRSGLEEVALRPDLVSFSDFVLRGTRGCSLVPVVILFSPGAASF
ncbi:MAG: UDP-N-acetylmuramoyl-L-alanine--D-glutamate ligase, partial [bacterium]|nr:UDP-N-acetylmuramoyl-L-alanine--D-glutamate ligase [bacterium]